MPPANSPAGAASPSTNGDAASSSRLDHPLLISPAPGAHTTPPLTRMSTPLESYWTSPVQDLAATLQVSDPMDDEAENLAFLRHSVELLDQLNADADARGDVTHNRASTAANQAAPRPTSEVAEEDTSRRNRLQRVLERLNRFHEPPLPTTSEARPSAYGNRTPSPSRQNLYDWAPSAREPDGHLDALIEQLRSSQPDLHADISRLLEHGAAQGRELRGGLAGAAERRERLRERERRRREQEWVNLRQRAAAQARSYRQGSPSATDRMLRYVMERERSGLSEEEERARGQGWFRPSPNRSSGVDEHASRDSWLLPPPAATSEGQTAVSERSSDLRERDRQERVEAFRRGYFAENVPPRLPRLPTPGTTANPAPSTHTQPAASTPLLGNALQYLNELRDCYSYHDSLSAAMDHGLATKEFFADKHDDFIMDLTELCPLPQSSWLQPGAIYEGHQHASSHSAILTHPSHPTTNHSVEQINPNFPLSNSATEHSSNSSHAVAPLAFDATRPWLSHRFTPPVASHSPARPKQIQDASHDHWPVRVVIHAVDEETMSLQGTMEAYDVPQHSSSLALLHHARTNSERPKAGRKGAPITTYMEGHIIDFSTHSLLTPTPPTVSITASQTQPSSQRPTPAFPPASPSIDATNLRKLPPFSHLASDDECARLLLSTTRLAALRDEYLLMRWKERCFVHAKDDACAASHAERQGDTDREHGLTISGFYYISLRRADGDVQGLYFDPQSTPYQCLQLKGRCAGWPSFQMR